MIIKRVIRPERLRQIPPSFSWVDHRLVSGHFIEQCDLPSLALYLFLVTVADVQGLSYYSEPSIGRRLRMSELELATARQQLERVGLIAYQKRLYQVLALEVSPPPSSSAPPERSGQTQSLGQILRRALEGGNHD